MPGSTPLSPQGGIFRLPSPASRQTYRIYFRSTDPNYSFLQNPGDSRQDIRRRISGYRSKTFTADEEVKQPARNPTKLPPAGRHACPLPPMIPQE